MKSGVRQQNGLLLRVRVARAGLHIRAHYANVQQGVNGDYTWLCNLLVAGDVWYFPANLPHSFVGLEPHGCLFVSGYKSPNFDELQAFSASTWLATLPVDTLAQVASSPCHTYICTSMMHLPVGLYVNGNTHNYA